MEWFSRKTSIAGYQIPNWALVLLVLAVVIVFFLIYFSVIDEFIA
jgi:hypothetical protein